MKSKDHSLHGQREHSRRGLRVSITDIENKLGVRFEKPELLVQAFTHPSRLNELPRGARQTDSYERLEFIGDAILGAIIAIELFRRNPGLSEGDMTMARSKVVSTSALANIAVTLGLDSQLIMGKGEDSSGGRERQSNLAAITESLIGAMFLDRGFDRTSIVVVNIFKEYLDWICSPSATSDAKSRLQTIAQQTKGLIPTYRVIQSEGPDHCKTYLVEVLLDGECLGIGEGKRKSSAEQQAALKALESLRHNSSHTD